MRMLLVAMLVMLSVAPVLAHDRDDDDEGRPGVCQCECMCPADAPVVCNCSAANANGPQTCGRIRARECKAVGLRPGCRRCIPTT